MEDNEKTIDKNPNISRGKAEQIALFAIYDLLLYAEMGLEADIPAIVSGLSEAPYEECDVYIKRMIIAFLKHSADIEAAFQARMPKWKFPRLNKVEQAILFLAYCHFFYDEEEVNKAVIINFSVSFAKKYLGEGDYRFVNAILDKVLVHE